MLKIEHFIDKALQIDPLKYLVKFESSKNKMHFKINVHIYIICF